MSENTKKELGDIFRWGTSLCQAFFETNLYYPSWKVLLPHPLYLFIRTGQKNTDQILRYGGRGPVHALFL